MEYVERFLRSFAPIVDEVILVRAIGSLPPDATIDKARVVCEELGKPYVFGFYKNERAKKAWPHVDDFSAARNCAFNLSTSTYALWADLDDVLESGADLIRQHADRGGYAAFLFPYKIPGQGVSIQRERMILRGAGKWIYPVHECFDFAIQPIQSVSDDRVVIRHEPYHTKSGSNERNLRILRSIPDEQQTAAMLYHLCGELSGAGDIPGAVAVAKRALAMPDLGRAERVELLLQLSFAAATPKEKEGCYLAAYAADPRRREALCFLACLCMDYGRNEDALAFARQFMATPMPPVYQWNERAAIYDWLGDDIFAQTLRVNGMADKAEAVRRAGLIKRGYPRIALLHATRGRPQKASQTRKLWHDMAERPELLEHIFIFDQDDEDSIALARMHHIVSKGPGCVAAWNLGAQATEATILVQLSDDWIPCPQWDRLICERLPRSHEFDPFNMRCRHCQRTELAIRETSEGECLSVNAPFAARVLAISDGHRTDDLLCMAICTRAYWQQDGYLFHPDFTGVFSDNWFTHMARKRGQVVEARDIVFEHRHPAFGGAEMDETYARQNAPERYAEGRAIFDRLSKEAI